MSWYIKVLKDYVLFSGRATRQEYWMFTLFNIIAFILASIIDSLLFGKLFGHYGPVYFLYGLGVLLPSLAVTVRRLHDINKSGWFILVSLIPLVGWIWLLILLVTDGTPGPNKYGESPK